MLIGVKKRFVFIANTKTGSTSIESVLVHEAEIARGGAPERKHITWRNARREYAFLFDNPAYAPQTFFRFGVIREPVDWIRSWYNYRRFRKDGGLPREMTFEQFWRSKDWVKNKGQKSIFVDADGVCRFDLIIPIEELRETLPVLFSALKVKQRAAPVENKSKGAFSRSEIPPDLIDEINQYYADDFSLYQESKERFQGALKQALEKIDSISNAGLQGESAGRKISAKWQTCNLVHAVKLSDLPGAHDGATAVSLRGVVIPQPDAPDDLRLVVFDADGVENPCKWNLPSPRFSAEYPGNPRAAHGRFRADGIRLAQGRPVELALVTSDGKRHGVCKISIA